jgi:hypothetical protein
LKTGALHWTEEISRHCYLIAMGNVFSAMPPRLSLNLNLGLKTPVAVGTPVIDPVSVFRFNPNGRLPETNDQA